MQKEDLYARFKGFSKLAKNWYNCEEGETFNINEIKNFIETFEKNYDFKLTIPFIFPVLNGDVQFEWINKEKEAELQVNLKTFEAEYFELDLVTNIETNIKYNLKDKTDWKSLNVMIENLFKE